MLNFNLRQPEQKGSSPSGVVWDNNESPWLCFHHFLFSRFCCAVIFWKLPKPSPPFHFLWEARCPHVSAPSSGASGLGSSPGQGHCVVFLGKTLYSHGASLHPGVKMGTGEFNAVGNPAMD